MLQQVNFRKLYLRFNYYGKGLEKYEELEVDECFGYLLRLAVNEKNKNLKKVKKRIYWIISWLVKKMECNIVFIISILYDF